MAEIYKTFYVICEGKSEYAYIQELNRFLRESSINSNLYAHHVGTGHYTEVRKQCKKKRKERRKDKIDDFIIWVDKDIYKRNEQDNFKKYSEDCSKQDFKFNIYNFEDFLVMHLSDEKVRTWQDFCLSKGHFENPMHEGEYLQKLGDEIFPDYSKGKIPIVISTDTLKNLKRNQGDESIYFKSDFSDFILSLISDI